MRSGKRWMRFMCAGVLSCVGLAALAADTELPEGRILLFDDYYLTNNAPTPTWVHEGPLPPGVIFVKALLPGTNHYHRSGWRLLSCRTGSSAYLSGGRSVPPVSPYLPYPKAVSNLTANLRNDLGALIESPIIQEGIGTIYFEAINNLAEYPTQITVELATNMVVTADGTVIPTVNPPSTNGLEFVWTPLDVLDLAAATTNDFVRYSRRLNFSSPAKMRIRRTGVIYNIGTLDGAFAVIDNIRVSLPPSDVVISKSECLFEPGYPAVNTNLTIRCTVGNADTNAPTVARTVKVCTRWRYLAQVIGAWRTNDMAYVEGSGDGHGNGEVYKAALPPQAEVGDLEYYFICAFDGVKYVSPDYTGTGLNGYPYPPELSSPRTLRGAAGEYVVRLRPYASEYGRVCVESDQHAEPVEMTPVGDGVWRALVPAGSLGLTNLTWRFKGTGAYEPGADAFSTGVTYWAATGPAGARYLPHGGVCVATGAAGRLGLSVDSGGYVMLTLNTRTLEYRANRAEYQNFNLWPARQYVFAESSSQATQQRHMNTFEGWPANVEQTFKESFAAYVGSTNVYSLGPFPTPQAWAAGSAAFVADRTEADYDNRPEGATGFRNLALRLKGGDGSLGLGYVHNTVATRTDGIKQVTFKCRLGQPASNFDVAFNRNEFTKTNYLVRASVRVFADLSPEQPSISLVGYYRDPGNFYEFRITQIQNDADLNNDSRVSFQLLKWVDGAPFVLKTIKPAAVFYLLTYDNTFEMRLFNDGSSATRIRCFFGNNVNDVIEYEDVSEPFQNGTYGFLSADCRVGFSSVLTRPTTGNAEQTGVWTVVLDSAGASFNTQKLNWYTPAGRFEALNSVYPYGIYSIIPTQKIGVYLQGSDYNSTEEPTLPGSPLWQKVQEITVPGFGYTSVTVPVNSWKAQFVKLQVMGGTADVAVDELAVSSWRGEQSGSALPSEWLATEAWVVSNGTSQANVVQLDHSRADPAADQAIRSLALDTGMGLMEFDCRVTRAPAKLTVQYAPKRDPAAWVDVQSFANSGTTVWAHVSAYLGKPEPGYLRVLNYRGGVYTNALVEIDNARVWDQPFAAPTDWRAYNAKITETDLTRVALDQSKACFLNNSQTLEADPVQDQSAPYLQSPALPTGLGALSFYARAYATNQAATVYVCASTNGLNAASNQWFEVCRFESITNTLYRLFSFEPADGRDYDAIRLMTATSAGARRVCLEEVVVAEPLFSDADIVSLCAEQPGLTYAHSGTNVDFTIRLAGRFALRKGDPDASEGLYPEIGMAVNGEQGWARLRTLNAFETPDGWRTEALFRYAVRPGDMAAPLKLSAPAGAGRSGNAYAFAWYGWEIFNQDSTSNAVWRFNRPLMAPSDAYDPDFSRAGVVLKTLAFAEPLPTSVGATETVTWHVKTDRAVGDAPVSFNVWSSNPSAVRVGAPPGQGMLTLTLGTGETDAAFTVCGVSLGAADLYVQRVHDYENNAAGGITNFIRRSVTVTPSSLRRWSEIAGTLTGGGTYKMNRCETDAGGVSVVCDGGGVGSVFYFLGDRTMAFTNLTLSVSNGATVVIEDLNIDNRSVEGVPAVCASDGHPQNTLALIGQNAVWGGRMAAGVNVQASGGATNALTVTSGAGTNGVLTALGGVLAAGIGGDPLEAGGLLSVGGHAVVTALGGDFGAGVGGGLNAAGGRIEVAGQAALLATGGGGGARDVGPGAYCQVSAAVRFTGGLILTGTGVGGVSGFATNLHHSVSAGVFDADGWYRLSRDGGAELGRLYVAAASIGVYSVSNVTQGGVYTLAAEDGGGRVTFEIVGTGPVVPPGVHGAAAFYRPWLHKYGLGSADLSALDPDVFDTAWLLDQNPQTFVSGELAITGIQVGSGVIRGTYAVRAVGVGDSVQTVTHVNGRLVVLGAETLSGSFEEIAVITDSVDAGTYVFEIPCLAPARFIKIEIAF